MTTQQASNKPHSVELRGDLGLRDAPQILDLLKTTLAAHDTINVSTAALTSADVTILQLLVSARKTALAAGKSLSLSASADGALRRALVRNGFVGADGVSRTPEGDFWTNPATP